MTVNIYGHLTRQAAHDAVEATAAALAAASPTQPEVGSLAGPAAPQSQSRTARPPSDHTPDITAPDIAAHRTPAPAFRIDPQ